ncbi:sensor histidine kinase [Nonomuraea sp. NPDC059194]|uniref:sensor histidine kinase n=1 Tax=Nonomuraea sp. NPDC059194 TaxID=3346764 RepID=UPI00367A7604
MGTHLRRLLTAPLRRTAWRELGYALVSLPMAAVGLVHLLVMLLTAAASATFVGVPMLAAGVVGARGLGAVDRGLARLLLDLDVPAPPRLRPRPGLIGWLGSALGDTVGWRTAGYLVAKPPAALVAFATATGVWGTGLLLLSCPLWWQDRPVPYLTVGTWPHALLAGVAGTVVLLLAPWAVRVALIPHRLLVRALLGPSRAAARIRELELTRARAVDDSAATLRRIERDLHDGTQAHLVALAMNLSMLKEELAEAGQDERLDSTRTLVDQAHRNAKDALTELRDLVRGIHPAVLDQGLEVALATLTAGSALPVELRVDLVRRPSAAMETIVYFCTAELLANAARHSGARHAVVELQASNVRLRLRVRDNGAGGAAPGLGTGLNGLRDRVRVVDGTLEISSPPGGPTVVTVELPLHT